MIKRERRPYHLRVTWEHVEIRKKKEKNGIKMFNKGREIPREEDLFSRTATDRHLVDEVLGGE